MFLVRRPGLAVRLTFLWRDLWIGVYVEEPWTEMGERWHRLYICLIPMFPLSIAWRQP